MREDDDQTPKYYSYPSKNVAHIFGRQLTRDFCEDMFNERDFLGEEDKHGNKPYLLNFHGGTYNKPFEWIVNKNKKEEFNWDKKIKFFFCCKHENSGKIESHLWFYKAFCAYTNPDYCQMIDAGTIPCQRSISKICKYMDQEPYVGGACGEIEVYEPGDKEVGYGFTRETDDSNLRKIFEIEKKIVFHADEYRGHCKNKELFDKLHEWATKSQDRYNHNNKKKTKKELKNARESWEKDEANRWVGCS